MLCCPTGDDQLGVRLHAKEGLFVVRIWFYLSSHCTNSQLKCSVFMLSPRVFFVSWLFQCTCSGSLHRNWASATIQGNDLKRHWGWAAAAGCSEPTCSPPQVLSLSLSDLSAVTHLIVSATNLNNKQVKSVNFLLLSVYDSVSKSSFCL